MPPRVALQHRFAPLLPGLGAVLLAGACAVLAPGGQRIHVAPPPSQAEDYCAWYADTSEDVLYLGLAAFWPALRAAGGDPAGDLRAPGPQLVARFDLASERFLSPLQVASDTGPSGIWDVEILPSGGLAFTRFYQEAGLFDPADGSSRMLPAAGAGLAELAPGPGGGLIATRYGGAGAVVLIDGAGEVQRELPLAVHEGLRPAPKTAAWDPARREIWVNTDLLDASGAAVGHDARILDASGVELFRWRDPELQFPLFDAQGNGLLAETEGGRLWLRRIPPSAPGSPRPAGRRVLLDAAYPRDVDFAQDVRIADDGRVLVTRWSGRVHLIGPADRAERIDLPRTDPAGLYYAATLRGNRLCASYCSGVTVVCRDAPAQASR